jgi:formylglycine-generating enzyme
MMWHKLNRMILSAAIVLAPVSAQAITIDMVPVGNPGNAPDTRYNNISVGAVGYTYNIGTYEVTAGQYTAFLNAVGGVDTYALYNTKMSIPSYHSGISRSGDGTVTNPYTYTVASDYANRPVNYVSFWDACRFANWLNNGQPSGAQGAGTTETGAYTLTTQGIAANTIVRNTTWKWAVTNENEWYKAAYYKGGSTNAGYWDYATKSDADNPPSNVLSSDGTNNANYYNGGYTDPLYRLTPVGEFAASPGPYGTFDQCGNAWEWTEQIMYGSTRQVRGGSVSSTTDWLLASMRAGQGVGGPAAETYDDGFRMVEVPEPGSIILLVTGAIAGLMWWIRRR